MEHSTKIIKMAASLLMFVVVVSWVAVFFKTWKGAENTQQRNVLEVLSINDKTNLRYYSGRTVLGSDVKYIIDKESAFCRVITKENLESFCTFSGMNDAQSAEYIDPSDTFICSCLYNASGDCFGLQFTEAGARNSSVEANNYLQILLKTKLLVLRSEESEIDLEIADLREKIANIPKNPIQNEPNEMQITGYSTLLKLQQENNVLQLQKKNLNAEIEKVRDAIQSANVGGE